MHSTKAAWDQGTMQMNGRNIKDFIVQTRLQTKILAVTLPKSSQPLFCKALLTQIGVSFLQWPS